MQEYEYLSKQLQDWYHENKRDLPWRNTKDPYKIWLSEIILQQTQVIQGLPYYEKFSTKYPEVSDLAAAPEDQIMRDWQGLGYYSRARNLISTAKYVYQELEGKFPDTYEGLVKLKGVGPYTASAISSFAFGENKSVVDGNVLRLISRLFGISTPINESKGLNEIASHAQNLLDTKNSDIHNQAMMELGAIICTPQSPKCNICPWSETCEANSQSLQKTLPVKTKKTKVRNRFLIYIVYQNDNSILLKKRNEKDIWKDLYDFPLIEISEKLDEEGLLNMNEFNFIIQNDFQVMEISNWQKHQLSHQSIWAKFLLLQNKKTIDYKKISLFQASDFYSIEESKDLGKPILILNFLDKYIY